MHVRGFLSVVRASRHRGHATRLRTFTNRTPLWLNSFLFHPRFTILSEVIKKKPPEVVSGPLKVTAVTAKKLILNAIMTESNKTPDPPPRCFWPRPTWQQQE